MMESSDSSDSETEAMPRSPSRASLKSGSGISNPAFVGGVNVKDLTRIDETSLHFSLQDSVYKSSIPTTVSPIPSGSEALGKSDISSGLTSGGFAVGGPSKQNGAQGGPLGDQLHHYEREKQAAKISAGQNKRLGEANGKVRSPRDLGNKSRTPRDKDREGVSTENAKLQSARENPNKIRSPRDDGKENKKHGDVIGKGQSSRDLANTSRDPAINLALLGPPGSSGLDIHAKDLLNDPSLKSFDEDGLPRPSRPHGLSNLYRSSSISDLRSLRSSERYMNDYIEYDFPRPSGHPSGRRSSPKRSADIYAVPNKPHRYQPEVRQNRKNSKLLPYIKPGSRAHRLLAGPTYDHISQSAFFTDGKHRTVKGPGVYGHLPDPEDPSNHSRGHKGLIDLSKKRFYPEVSVYGRKRRGWCGCATCWPPWAILLLILLILLILAVIIACILLIRPKEKAEPIIHVVTAPPVTCPPVTTKHVVTTAKQKTTTTTAPFNPVGGQVVEFPDNPSKYVIVKSAIPWKQAAGKCFSFGGHLAQLESAEEWDQLRNHLLTLETLRDNTRSINYWIGGITLLPEASYFWYVSGEPLSSSLWSPGEPNYSKKRENCVAIDVARQGLLNDSECEGLNLYVEGFVCEIPKDGCVTGRRS